MSENNIHPTAVINWEKVEIGHGNIIGPYVCIGTDAQHVSSKSDGIIRIGDNNTFREFSTVHLPTSSSKVTEIGNKNYFMCNSHVAHDCKIEDQVTLCVGAVLNGHVRAMIGAYIGSGVQIHQFQTIGSYSMLGMNSTVPKKCELIPGSTYIGSPAKRIGINKVALERNNISAETLEKEIKRYYRFVNSN